MKKIFCWTIVLALILISPLSALADAIDPEIVVSLGADLNDSQQKQMLKLFGVEEEEVKKVVEENKGIIKKILEAIENFFAWLRGLLG